MENKRNPLYKNHLLHIDKIFAYISTDVDGNEGVISMNSGDTWLPLVGADEARMISLKPHVQAMVERAGIKVTLCEFSVRKDLEVFQSKLN